LQQHSRATSSRQQQRVSSRRSAVVVYAAAATTTKTVKIGTRGSPLALAQAYLTRDLLKVCVVLRL
jgi:hydroxymethylbilane synthase